MKIDENTTIYVVSKIPGEVGHVNQMSGLEVSNLLKGSNNSFYNGFEDFDFYTDETEAHDASQRLELMARIETKLRGASLTDLVELHETLENNQISKVIELLETMKHLAEVADSGADAETIIAEVGRVAEHAIAKAEGDVSNLTAGSD